MENEKAISFIAHIDSVKVDKDGGTKLTLNIPISDQKAIRDIMQLNGEGKTNFGCGMIPLDRSLVQENVIPEATDILDEINMGHNNDNG